MLSPCDSTHAAATCPRCQAPSVDCICPTPMSLDDYTFQHTILYAEFAGKATAITRLLEGEHIDGANAARQLRAALVALSEAQETLRAEWDAAGVQ